MGHKQHGQPLFPLQPAQQSENAGLGDHVKRRGRFVGQQQRRFAGQRQGDGGALFLAAGQFVRITTGDGGVQFGFRQQLGDARLGRPAAQAQMNAQNFLDVGPDRFDGREGILRPLRHQRDFFPAQAAQRFLVERQKVLTGEDDGAGCDAARRQKPQRRHDDAGLAAARFPDKADESSLRHVERHPRNRLMRLAGVTDAELFNVQHDLPLSAAGRCALQGNAPCP